MMILRFFDRLLFAPVSALGFGLMRSAWGAIVFLSLLMMLPDRILFFSDSGLLPPDLAPSVLRGEWRFSLLDHAGAAGVDLFFAGLLTATLCMMLGVLPRASTVVSVLLLWSLHERNPFVFAGGDTVLRLLGFILVVAPSLDAFSWKRLRLRRRALASGTSLPALSVPSYAYRLLLWQMIVLYGASLFEKLSGSMWPGGTAVEVVLHHPVFARLPLWAMNILTPISSYITWGTLLFHTLWLLLLIPRELTAFLPRFVPRIRLKRMIIAIGILFHGSILLLLDAGNFSLVLFTAYLGLLLDEDFAMLTTLWNWRMRGKVTVLYDGTCGLCVASTAFLLACDWGKRLQAVDFRSAGHLPENVSRADLERAMHVVSPTGKTLAGFFAFRELAEHCPPLLPLIPLLWLPGVGTVGSAVYGVVARNRKCLTGTCKR